MIYRIFFVFILTTGTTLGQITRKSDLDIEAWIERLFPVPDEEMDYESIYELLNQLYLDPLDLNMADGDLLESLQLLSPLQIQSLLAYRAEQGPLISIYELQAIPHFDLETIQLLAPFVRIGLEKISFKTILKQIWTEENNYLILRHRRTWERRRGYLPQDPNNPGTRYLGDQNDLFIRSRIHHGRAFSVGFTIEKDAGEQLWWKNNQGNRGPDFSSFHFYRGNTPRWKSIALGDFRVGFGQGLVFGAGYSLGKGAETITTVRRSSFGLLPYTASTEAGFFRGAGVTKNLGLWSITTFLSHVKRDGRVNLPQDTLESQEDFASSLPLGGFHRTPSELSTRKAITESNAGFNTTYQLKNGRGNFGFNALYTTFEFPLNRRPNIYNSFEFSGKTNWIGSFYGNYYWKNIFLFGESARSKSGGQGSVFGLITSLNPKVALSMIWRNYDRNFHSFYGNGFGENTRNINERGTYLGIEIKPSKKWKFNGYLDLFRFPWLKFRTYAPSDGYEWLARVTYQPRRDLLVYAQLRKEEKDRNLSDSGEPTLPFLLSPVSRQNFMINLETNLSRNLFIRSRILTSQVNIDSGHSKGFMIFQDIRSEWEKWRLTAQMAFFDTDDYDSRIYTFENNVLWTFSIPAFFGQGMRYYLIGEYAFSGRLKVYARFSRTSYTDRDRISSGLQEILGSRQTDSAILIRYSFR